MRRIAVLVLSVAVIASPAAAHAGSKQGTVHHPYPVGHYHHIDKTWTMKTIKSDYNADAEIHDANQFNDKPKHGRQYVLVTVRGKCLRGSNHQLWADEGFKLLGRKTHTLYSQAIVVAPHDLSDQDSVSKGGKETGNLAFEVRKSDIHRGHLLLWVESEFSFDAPAKYYRTR